MHPWTAIFADADIAAENAPALYAGVAATVIAVVTVGVTAYTRLHRRYKRLERAQIGWLKTFDSIDDLILVHDNDNQVIRVNRALAERLGRQPVEAVGKTCDILLPRVPPGGTCPYCSRYLRGVEEGEDPCFGGRSVVSTSFINSGESAPAGTIHIISDVTEQVAAEERYRRLFHGIREGVFIRTAEGRILDCNDALVKMLGYSSRTELMQVNMWDISLADADHKEAFRQAMSTRGFVQNHEVTLRRKDGQLLTALETSFVTRDPASRAATYQGFLIDVTETRRAEEQVRRRSHELKVLNEIASISSQSLDLDQVLHEALRHIVELFKADTGSAYIFDWSRRVLTCRAAIGHSESFRQAIRSIELPEVLVNAVTEQRMEMITREHVAQAPGGILAKLEGDGLRSGMWLVLWGPEQATGLLAVSSREPDHFSEQDHALLVAVGRQLAMTIENVRLYEQTYRAYDDLRRTQEQLLQSEKMSAVGQLISGVAHELNNPLTAVLGYAQILEAEPISPRAREFVQKIFRQAQRTHRVVQNLLSFARQHKPKREDIDLRRVMQDTLMLRDYDLKLNNVAVVRDFAPDLPLVTGDPHQLEQVFLNIINNAVDAMLEQARGGRLRVRLFAENGSVCAELHDSGPGLRDTKRIFDPFYTTKQVGKGTGLGLSICYGIVKEHGGDIQGSNHPEGGAVFHVRLPIAAVQRPAKSTHQADEEEFVLTGRILLVDDEEPVLDFEREVLSGAGASIVALTRGEQSIPLLQRQSFDVLILDAAMPGRYNGVDICDWLLANRPELLARVILTISNVEDAELRSRIQSLGVRSLSKPFHVGDLLSACRAVLQKSRSAAAHA